MTSYHILIIRNSKLLMKTEFQDSSGIRENGLISSVSFNKNHFFLSTKKSC